MKSICTVFDLVVMIPIRFVNAIANTCTNMHAQAKSSNEPIMATLNSIRLRTYRLEENLAARIPPGSCVTIVAAKYAVWKRNTYVTDQSVR